MKRLLSAVKGLSRRIRGAEAIDAPPLDAPELRRLFQDRYLRFRLLLTANNQALEAMAELEEALAGNRLFGMHFVRSRVTRVTAQVFRIIQHLDGLAPEKYTKLYERFQNLALQLEGRLAPHRTTSGGPLVLPLYAMDGRQVDQAGAKIANLAEIARDPGFNVPDGFVVTAAGCDAFLDYVPDTAEGEGADTGGLRDEICRRIQAAGAEDLDQVYALSSDLQSLISRAPLPQSLETAITQEITRLAERHGDNLSLALRSSALGEDMAEAAFAGQFRSELNVRPENALETYREIVASLYSARAMVYRLQRGLPHDQVSMCVGVLRMVRPQASGVLYTRNPMGGPAKEATGHDRSGAMVVSSVWGLPRPVVDGSLAPDVFHLSREETPQVIGREVAHKPEQYVCSPDEGVCRLEVVGQEQDLPSLTENQASLLGRMALTLERKYGHPLDIEWALEDGKMVILQCRPLAQAPVWEPSDREEIQGTALLEGGTAASPGVASGTVFRMTRHGDALSFPTGAVLVTAQALPRWAPLLTRAAAVVAERGSVTSHLANVAREIGIPALFGLAGALDKLEQDLVVTVDADSHRVLEGALVPEAEKPARHVGMMTGTPVHQTLSRAAELILPLSMLDPDSTDFRPESVRSLHDITRFCHEQAVREMFRFGKDHSFPERSGKRLVTTAPTQWWVLNLDDGFIEEAPGRMVQLANIASTPMLALWEGITAYPWEGPPALDSKGFMAVMFRATTNPALAAGTMSTPYTTRNYFMISKNYVSLSSRFGFHFSTVEALVGDRVAENYAAFTFKGGAADDERRALRIQFVSEFLEEYGFRSRVKEDHLSARLENRGMEFMLGRLRILGYLIIHTRQLDMIMTNAALVSRYRNKFMKDIGTAFDIQPSV